MCLDELIPADHPARTVWEFVVSQDLSALYNEIQAIEGEVGRNAIDPQILFALWLYAITEGIGSAGRSNAGRHATIRSAGSAVG